MYYLRAYEDIVTEADFVVFLVLVYLRIVLGALYL